MCRSAFCRRCCILRRAVSWRGGGGGAVGPAWSGRVIGIVSPFEFPRKATQGGIFHPSISASSVVSLRTSASMLVDD
eukprot:6064958-Prymnesium_polylepis.1